MLIKRTIEYENYDGVTVKEDFYFNFTQAELTMMELSEDGGLAARLRSIIDKKDGKSIMATFRDILLKSYGVKSPDGRRFIKSDEISKEFSETPAYDILFTELVTDPGKALQFVQALIPKQLRANDDAREKREDPVTKKMVPKPQSET